MRKTSNSSSTDSELEALEIEINRETQNDKTKNINKHEINGIISNNPQLPNGQILPPKLPPKTNNQIPLPQMSTQYVPQCVQNNNPQIPSYNMAQTTYLNTEITRINHNIQILDKNDKVVFKKIKSYQEQNDYLIASLIFAIGIFSCCNPILLTIGKCMLPNSTSDKQRWIMTWMTIAMIFSWILFAIGIITSVICATIV